MSSGPGRKFASAHAEMEKRLSYVTAHFSVAAMTDHIEALYAQALVKA